MEQELSIEVQRDGQRLGCFTVPVVLGSLSAGELRPDDLAWHEGLQRWMMLKSLLASLGALGPNQDAMLQRFTEKHPDVVSTRRLIKELEEQKQQEIVARRKKALTNPDSSENTNPVYQQLKVSLSETEARVAALQTRVAEYQARYDRLKSAVTLVPQIEAEFAQLNRDYEINKKNYEQLVQRRESATLGSEMDNVAGVDFRLIDPPRASPKPVAPNRALFLPLTLLLALAAGVAVTFAASQLRPVFFEARSLREACGLPLLGTVSLVADEGRKSRERKTCFALLRPVSRSSVSMERGFSLFAFFPPVLPEEN